VTGTRWLADVSAQGRDATARPVLATIAGGALPHRDIVVACREMPAAYFPHTGPPLPFCT
jgi:hypothetical protein